MHKLIGVIINAFTLHILFTDTCKPDFALEAICARWRCYGTSALFCFMRVIHFL